MRRGHLPPVDPELKHAINANLAYIRSGAAKRDKEAQSAKRKEHRQRLKQLTRKIPQLKKREAALRDELEKTDKFFAECEASDNPMGYAEGMTAAQKQGLLEEIDSAREGCLTELLDVEQQLKDTQAELERIERILDNG